MLLEGWRISQALKEAGVKTEARTSDVAAPGKTGGPCMRIAMSNALDLAIYPVEDEKLDSLWTFRQGNFHFWPIIRPPEPLIATANDFPWHVFEANKIKSLKTRKEQLATIYETALADSVPSVARMLDSEETERDHHQAKITKLPPEIQELGKRLSRIRSKSHWLEDALRRAAVNPDLHAALFKLFFGKVDKGSVKATGQIAFDLYEGTIYTNALRSMVEANLADVVSATGGAGSSVPVIVCSLAGAQQQKHQGKFPNPSLPVVSPAGIAMFSMFSDAPTNTRYGLSDDRIVSIGMETVKASQDALKHVTSESMKNNSWRPFPNGKTKDKKELSDLLIAYTSGIDTGFAAGFGENDPEQLYEDLLRPVLHSLTELVRLTPDAEIVLILLRQVSNAQVQCVYSRKPLASRMLDSGRRWFDAQTSRPTLRTEPNVPAYKRKYVSPASAVRLLGKTWAGRPPKSTRLVGPSGGDTLDFFLAQGSTRVGLALPLLALALQRYHGLLTHIGESLKEEPVATVGKIDIRIAEADRAAFLLTVLLDAMDRKMENTTRSPEYLLGLLLNLVDTLHLRYCQVVRKSVPPTLGGSQLLGIAADNPAYGLCQLLERIRPWHSWARTSDPQHDKDPDSAQKTVEAQEAVHRISIVTPLLSNGVFDKGLDPIGKAELLLGFLSRDDQADKFA